MKQTVTLSFMAVIAVAVFVTGVQAYELKKVHDLGQENKKRITEAAEIRRDLFRELERADLRLCLTQEKLKTQNRTDAKENFSRLDENLELLQIPKTPAIVQRARENLERDLKRNAPAEC